MTCLDKMRFKGVILLVFTFVLMMNNNAYSQRAIIKTDNVEIYSLPMVDNTPVATLIKGDTIRVIGQRGNWVKVKIAQNRKGWMLLEVKSLPGKSPARTIKKEKPARQLSMASANGKAGNGAHNPEPFSPDLIRKNPNTIQGNKIYRRFGYTFGAGVLGTDFTYNWKFIFHQTPRMALEGSFKHALGEAASSYFIFANLNYMLKENTRKKFLPYATAGVGIINTVPENSIDIGQGVSNMAINYGLGVRKYYREKLSLLFNVSQYSVFIGKGVRHFREYTVGLLVGKFWD